jgi:hypothetical protein
MNPCFALLQGEKLYSPVPYHFLPSPLHHIFTLVYPDGAADDRLGTEFACTVDLSHFEGDCNMINLQL